MDLSKFLPPYSSVSWLSNILSASLAEQSSSRRTTAEICRALMMLCDFRDSTGGYLLKAVRWAATNKERLEDSCQYIEDRLGRAGSRSVASLVEGLAKEDLFMRSKFVLHHTESFSCRTNCDHSEYTASTHVAWNPSKFRGSARDNVIGIGVEAETQEESDHVCPMCGWPMKRRQELHMGGRYLVIEYTEPRTCLPVPNKLDVVKPDVILCGVLTATEEGELTALPGHQYQCGPNVRVKALFYAINKSV